MARSYPATGANRSELDPPARRFRAADPLREPDRDHTQEDLDERHDVHDRQLARPR
jgi:hypothetical protein